MNKAQSLRRRCSVTCDVAPARQRRGGQEQAGHAIAGINVVVTLDRARLRRQWLSALADQLLEGLVHADHGPLGIMGRG